MRDVSISEKKQKLLDAKNNSPLEVGEEIYVFERAVGHYNKNSDKVCLCTISSLKDGIKVYSGTKREKSPNAAIYTITKSDIDRRYLFDVGANPFEKNVDSIRPVAFTLDSIVFALNVFSREDDEKYNVEGISIKRANWNPFIYDKEGNKQYYQRPFVWSVQDNQLLIESIYHNIDCGKILVRKRGWDELKTIAKQGNTELAWHDIVDGKQRLNAVRGFIEGEFTDLQGNYYGDLSYGSQRKFNNHQLFSYAEMPENTKDEDVIRQFLKLNFAGVPQSQSHIEFVKSLQSKF